MIDSPDPIGDTSSVCDAPEESGNTRPMRHSTEQGQGLRPLGAALAAPSRRLFPT